MTDPAVARLSAAMAATSAQLTQTQAALAASQQDLTSMEAKRDQAIENGAYWNREWKQASAERDDLRKHLDLTGAELDQAAQDRENLTSERDALALLNAELTAEVLQVRADNVKHAEREQQLRRMIADAERDLKAAGDDAEKRAAEQARYIAGVEHDLEHARFERDRARSWQVARNDDTGACFVCGRPIVRGQAVEPQPGTTKGSYAHVECPDREAS